MSVFRLVGAVGFGLVCATHAAAMSITCGYSTLPFGPLPSEPNPTLWSLTSLTADDVAIADIWRAMHCYDGLPSGPNDCVIRGTATAALSPGDHNIEFRLDRPWATSGQTARLNASTQMHYWNGFGYPIWTPMLMCAQHPQGPVSWP
jgi:hypothetical protein